MRTKRLQDPTIVATVELPKRVGSGLSDEAEAYVTSALSVETMALDLAQRNTKDDAAVAALIEAAGGDVRVMRRAHRHSEMALSEQWPAGRTVVRAFDYLSAGRLALEERQSQDAEVGGQPVVVAGSAPTSTSAEEVYDIVDEASMESFPASDAPSFWGR